VLAGVEIQPVDGSPAAFTRPVEVRLNYSKCVPEPESGGRGLLRGDSGGRAWRVQEGSGRSLLRREVSGGIVQTAITGWPAPFSR
jgi:hypothetical protein